MRHTRQGVRSKRENTQVLQPELNITTINGPPKKHYNIYVEVTVPNNTIYTTQGGKLPVTSRTGQKYLMIMCDLVSNIILADRIKIKTEKGKKNILDLTAETEG